MKNKSSITKQTEHDFNFVKFSLNFFIQIIVCLVSKCS